MSTRSDIINEALLSADKVYNNTVNRAKDELYEAFSEKIEKSVKRALDETVGVGKDQPSGYAQDEDRDALAFGSSKHSTAKKDDINKGGKGPQKLEGSINVDEMYEEDEDGMDEVGGGNFSGGDFGSESDEDPLDVIPVKDEELDEMFGDEEDSEEELDETSEEDEELDEASDEEDLDEKKEEDVDESKEEDVDEVATLKDENKTLKAENKEYKKAFRVLEHKFNETNLLSAKLAGAGKFLKSPNLTIKQKESIVEIFDRAKNVNEVKLIVKTLSESTKFTGIRKPIVERSVRSTSSKRINESNEFGSSRLQQLAGIN